MKHVFFAGALLLTPAQREFGCSIMGPPNVSVPIILCPSPGTGLCWIKGHNPYFDRNSAPRSTGNWKECG
jgi:hypothetical protein